MTLRHRLVLLLLALPFSGALALGTYVLLEISPAADAGIAIAVFVASELVLHRLAALIPPRSGPETLPGREARVITGFRPERGDTLAGYVLVHGERWRARLPASMPAPVVGQVVKVERVERLTLWVSTDATAMPGDPP